MRSRTSREVAALGLLGALAACGSEELFEQRLAANQKSIRSEAVARITSDDRVLGRVAGVGDMDGDGIDDAILLSSAVSTGYVETSTLHVVYGGDALHGTLAATRLPVLDEHTQHAWRRYEVAAAGDVDGDGLADVLAWFEGAVGCGPDPADQPRTGAYLVYGSRTRVTTAVPLWQRGVILRDADVCSIDTMRAHGVGDLDGDGKDELAIIMIEKPLGEYPQWVFPLRIYVLYGGERSSGTVDLRASAAVEIRAASVSSGIATGPAGDLDGDGYGDFYVQTGNRGLDVVYGGAARLTGSRALDEIRGTHITGTDICIFDAVSALGDLDRDGRDDLGVQACATDSSLNPERSSHAVFYGRDARFPAQLALAEADATLVTRGYSWDHLASGDLDGDGYLDLVIGDTDIDSSGGQIDAPRGSKLLPGGVATIMGGPERLTGSAEVAAISTTYLGTRVHARCPEGDCLAPELVGLTIAVGDLTGDGLADVLATAPGVTGNMASLGDHGSSVSSVYLVSPGANP